MNDQQSFQGIEPSNYAEPFRELIYAAGKLNGFKSGDSQLTRESLANIRSIKQRTIEAIDGISWLQQQAEDGHDAVAWSKAPMELLTDLLRDMDTLERRIVDSMIVGGSAS
ncbi:hypothetical protein [Thiohalobacter thiocyanaticus]|uniref:Uncharacterized protein n=1 Tax=Thiohalobacter thiocyanaticus TaxID=585455 RepID=A0A426QMK7_9GAMM|nr:hypothetical protein [Thiohalobacter thiocyanaticus]RRQ22906.1 hypothetical protein D6C00_13870 [Thiohalobacter thiocyanaticus]